MSHEIVVRGGLVVAGTGREPFRADVAIDNGQITAVGQALDHGAVGFSTNRFAPHKLPDGRSIPGTFADPAELVAIAGAVSARDGLMQTVGADFDVLRAMADQGHARVLCSYGGGIDHAAAVQRRAAFDELCVGRDVTAVAQVLGLTDRGVIAPGMRADLNVFDADTIAEQQPVIVHDFPGGAPRYIQRSTGYKATLVNGQVLRHRGARATSRQAGATH